MDVRRIDHVSLNVSDRGRSLDWFADVLGMRGGQEGDPAEPVFVGEDGAQIALFSDRAPGLRHVALATSQAGFSEMRDRLDGLGIEYQFVEHGSHDSLYFADPDGHTVEVMVEPT